MAIDQVDRRVVSERPTVTSREAARGATAPAVTSFTKTYRTTAKIVGAVYLAGFVVGLVGSGIFQSILGATGASANLPAVAVSSVLLAFGAILWLMAVAGDAAHGVLMFPNASHSATSPRGSLTPSLSRSWSFSYSFRSRWPAHS